MRGNLVAKVKRSIFSTFGENTLPCIINPDSLREVMDWKKKKEVKKAYKNLHKKINNDEEAPTWCNKILQKVFIKPATVAKPLLAFAIGVIEITLDPENGSIRIKDDIMRSKIQKNIVSLFKN